MVTYLIPELMVLTTSLSDLDEKVRTQISKKTIKNPEQKLNLVENLLKKIDKEIEDGGFTEMKNTIGIDISPKALKFEVKKIPPPKLSLVGTNTV